MPANSLLYHKNEKNGEQSPENHVVGLGKNDRRSNRIERFIRQSMKIPD